MKEESTKTKIDNERNDNFLQNAIIVEKIYQKLHLQRENFSEKSFLFSANHFEENFILFEKHFGWLIDLNIFVFAFVWIGSSK